MVRIETHDEMMTLLNDYRNNRNEYMMLCLKALPRSPSFEGVPGQNATPVDQQLNKLIDRKDELEEKIRLVEVSVERLKDVSQDYYRVIYYHYVSINHQMSLNRISSELFGFDDYTNFWRGGWHRDSLNALFKIMRSIKKL